MKISLQKLHHAAATRPPGYLEEVLAAGAIKDGYLFLTPAAAENLFQKYRPSGAQSIAPPPPARMRGLGDAIARIAKPIARRLDRALGTRLANCKSCSRRQAKLNAAVPFKRGVNKA